MIRQRLEFRIFQTFVDIGHQCGSINSRNGFKRRAIVESVLQSMVEKVSLDTSFSIQLVDEEMSDKRLARIFCIIGVQGN